VGAGLISATLGTRLPGPGTIYLGQDLRFRHPMSIGDTITSTVTVREKKAAKGDVTLDCVCTNQKGEAVITGSAFTRAPTEKVRVKRVALPYVRVGRHDAMRAVLARAAGGAAVATAVVYPVDAASLLPVLDAAAAGLIVPVLVGPAARIQAVAKAAGVDIAALRLVDAPDGPAAASQEGDLHTEDLMHAVVASQTGLRTTRRRAGLSTPAAGDGCRHQHHADLGRQGGYRAERDRPGACDGDRAATRSHSGRS
jgi:hypothetical protein